jgi:hypothetical protein
MRHQSGGPKEPEMSDMLELAKRIAERAGKNAKVAPELLYAPILWELQDDARSSADSVQTALERELAGYDKTIAEAKADDALSESGRQRVIECCWDAKGAIRKFAAVLSAPGDAEPQASAGDEMGYHAAWLEMIEHCSKLKEENFLLRQQVSAAPQAARADIEDIADIIRDKAYADENDKIGGVHDAAQKIVEYLTTLPARCQAESVK